MTGDKVASSTTKIACLTTIGLTGLSFTAFGGYLAYLAANEESDSIGLSQTQAGVDAIFSTVFGVAASFHGFWNAYQHSKEEARRDNDLRLYSINGQPVS